jgi:hypothetical protein
MSVFGDKADVGQATTSSQLLTRKRHQAARRSGELLVGLLGIEQTLAVRRVADAKLITAAHPLRLPGNPSIA